MLRSFLKIRQKDECTLTIFGNFLIRSTVQVHYLANNDTVLSVLWPDQALGDSQGITKTFANGAELLKSIQEI